MPDDYLVSFPGTVMRVNAKNYYVKDLSSGASITVKPYNGKSDGTSVEITDATLALKNVTVKGHLYTIGGVQMVTYSTVTSTGNPTLYTISGKVSNGSGAGISGATVYFSDVAHPQTNPIVTATTDAGGNYSKGVTTGNWYVAAGASAYNTSEVTTPLISQPLNVTANVSGVNFTLVANASVSGKVTKRSDGTAISGAKVYFSTSPNASASPTFTATTDSNGNYTQAVQNGTWYVAAGGTGWYTSIDTTVVMEGDNVPGINYSLKSNTRNIPRTEALLFSAVTESLPASGATGNWATYMPSGQTLTAMGSPTVESINGMKWEKNLYADGDGFRQGTYSSPITVNGATVVVAVKPTRNGTGTSWTSVVDIFYDRLLLGVKNDTGLVCVRRNGSLDLSSTAIPDGQITILTLIVQSDGSYKVWANGAQIMTGSATGANSFISLVNGVAGGYANSINVGRNDPDGWTTFNGDIGDVFVYNIALTDVAGTGERQQLEADLLNKFMTYNITATAGANGSISPPGTTVVDYSGSQTYTIAPNVGYAIADVKVDNVSQGAISTYTFTNVQAAHTISATFGQTCTINASAGANGTISPSGTVVVVSGSSPTFTMAANTGYRVSNVVVDGVNKGAITTYTFSNITLDDHAISATFISTDFIAYYKFDETSGTSAYDWSGNSRNGTLTGITTIGAYNSWVAGFINNSVRFSTTTSQYGKYVTMPLITGTYTGFTMSMWANPEDTAGKYLYYNTGTGAGTVRIQMGAASGDNRVFTVSIAGNSNSPYVFSAVSVPSNQWSHIAVTYDKSNVALYLNGGTPQLISCTGTTKNNPSFTGATNYIGAQSTTASTTFVGRLDDFRLYNRALSGTEVHDLYAADAPTFTINASAGSGGSITPSGTITTVLRIQPGVHYRREPRLRHN